MSDREIIDRNGMSQQPPDYSMNGKRQTIWPNVSSLALGLFFLILWLKEEMTTVVPGSSAVFQVWLWSRIYLFAGGISLGVSIGMMINNRRNRRNLISENN